MALSEAQEKFCANIVRGMTQKDAYMDAFAGASAGSAGVQASKLMRRPEIIARVGELRTVVRENTDTTVKTIIDELEDARQVAKKENSPNMMMKASLLKARILGFVGDDNQLGAGLSVSSVNVNFGNDMAGLKQLRDAIIDDE